MSEQLTEQWFKDRAERITGSIVGAILGCDPFRKPADIMRMKVRDYHGAPSEFVGNVATDWGSHMESQAVTDYEIFHGGQVQEMPLVVHPEHDWLAASPDGRLDENTLIEIKCPFSLRNAEHPQFKNIDELPHYYAQVQMEMYCTGATRVHFYQWAPHGDNVQVIDFDPEYIERILPVLRRFYESYLVERNAPERHLEPRHAGNDSPLAADLLDQYAALDAEIKRLDAEKKDTLAKLIEICGRRESQIGERKLSLVKRKGSINYKKVPELKGVDLEPYRGADSEFWRVF